MLNSYTDHQMGGERFTEALAQHLATEFKRSVPPGAADSRGGRGAIVIVIVTRQK